MIHYVQRIATERDGAEKVVQAVRSAQLRTGVPPTLRQIAAAVGWKSTSTVVKYLDVAVDLELLEKVQGPHRGRGLSHAYRIPIVAGHCGVCGHAIASEEAA
jgi:LexA DNA binding domain-containing protein